MKLVREVLYLKLAKKSSNREIALIHFISKTTVANYVSRAEIGEILSLEKLISISDEQLRKIIFPFPNQTPKNIKIDFEWVQQELSRKNVTLMLLWKELSEKCELFYSYSRFCDLHREWSKTKNITMKMIHKAGEKLFIDYAGTTVPVVVSKKTGEVRDAQIYICCLGASQLTYLEATWSQSSKDFISATIHAFEFYGGAPELLVPDNLKSAVNIASKYEPLINQSFRSMAKHYDCAVLPARIYRPKDKAKVENAVLIASRWIIARIRDEIFFSLEELNKKLWELLEEFNNKKYQKMNYSRRSFFEDTEKAALKILPSNSYEVAEWKKVKPNIDYHVQLENSYYSVPYTLRGYELECRYTDSTVEFFKNTSRIASHVRSFTSGSVSTVPDHMPRSHREQIEWSPAMILDWAHSVGPLTESFFKILMERSDHLEIAYKACKGIIGLGKIYENSRIENACERALYFGAVGYKSIKSILENGLDKIETYVEQKDLGCEHENIRGKNYYQ